jgi:hypothetical protein
VTVQSFSVTGEGDVPDEDICVMIVFAWVTSPLKVTFVFRNAYMHLNCFTLLVTRMFEVSRYYFYVVIVMDTFSELLVSLITTCLYLKNTSKHNRDNFHGLGRNQTAYIQQRQTNLNLAKQEVRQLYDK